MALKIKFWGVRGSIACASPDHMKYGGNTSCIEVQAGELTFVMDAGRRAGMVNLNINQSYLSYSIEEPEQPMEDEDG